MDEKRKAAVNLFILLIAIQTLYCVNQLKKSWNKIAWFLEGLFKYTCEQYKTDLVKFACTIRDHKVSDVLGGRPLREIILHLTDDPF